MLKRQEEAILQEHYQIPSMKKFEDRPMSPDTWDGLTLLLVHDSSNSSVLGFDAAKNRAI